MKNGVNMILRRALSVSTHWLALAGLIVGISLASARAEVQAPDELVKKLAAEMTQAVRNDPELQNPNSVKISDFVQRNIVPRFDFDRITQIAMGRNWAKATQSEQKQIASEFGKLLTRTYSNAISTLKDLDVEVKTTRVTTPNVDVTVKTQMIGRAQPVTIDYGLINSPAGWKVYDVTVEGISLVAAYRDEFNGLVSSSGVQGVIDVLKKKNGG
jgi:phospholipid transport system substrate-binding protein